MGRAVGGEPTCAVLAVVVGSVLAVLPTSHPSIATCASSVGHGTSIARRSCACCGRCHLYSIECCPPRTHRRRAERDNTAENCYCGSVGGESALQCSARGVECSSSDQRSARPFLGGGSSCLTGLVVEVAGCVVVTIRVAHARMSRAQSSERTDEAFT